MRIFLGAALLSIAFAAPIKDEDHPSFPAFPQFPAFPDFPTVTEETPAQEKVTTDSPTTPPSVATVSAGLEKLLDASTALPTHVEEDIVNVEPEEVDAIHPYYDAFGKGFEQFNEMHQNEDELRQKLRAKFIPEVAIDEIFAEKFHLSPFDDDKYDRFMEYAKRWRLQGRLAQATPETTEVPETATPESFSMQSDEEHNAAAIKGEDEIRAALRKSGVPEAAIREFIEQEFHLLPFSLDKYRDFNAWGRRWGVEQVSKFRWTSKDGGRLYLETPGEAWTVDVSEPEAQKVRENNQRIREMFARMGLPEEAIDEFIDLGISEEPHDERKQVLAMNWVMKWQFAFPAAREMQEIGKEVTDEVATIFMHTYLVSSNLQAFQDDGVMTEEKLHYLKEMFSHLSEFEYSLIQKVLEHAGEKVATKYGLFARHRLGMH